MYQLHLDTNFSSSYILLQKSLLGQFSLQISL